MMDKEFDREVDRHDERGAARWFNTFWPDARDARACATLLANSIEAAHEAGAGAWAVALHEDCVRLSVGQVEAVTLFSDVARLLACTPVSSENRRGLRIEHGSNPVYPSVPVPSVVCTVDVPTISHLPQDIIDAHVKYIREAASRKRVTPHQRSFSPSVVAYLETTTGRLLPRPSYVAADERQRTSRLIQIEQALETDGAFDPDGLVDGRLRIERSIVERRGQQRFRARLLRIYEGRCAISSCAVQDVLEAAHVVPYLGPETNHPANGLLLRADLHTLFDLGLIAIDTSSMTVLVADELKQTEYGLFHGRKLELPDDARLHPNQAGLNRHREESWIRPA